MPGTIVVVPTYNEKENLPSLERALREKAPGTHLLIVDDGSPDGTGKIADDLAASRPGEVFVLHRTGKLGLGTAYLQGFKIALEKGYDVIVQMDCDFSHDPAMVPVMVKTLAEGNDLVLGSRWVAGGGTVNWGLSRKIISRGGSFYARQVLGMPFRDITGGFKCWKRSTLETIPLDRINAHGYGFQIEMTYRAFKLGMKIREIPITFVDRQAGVSKMSKKIVFEALLLCWKIRSAA